MKSARERFEEKYIPVTESGCWLWTAALTTTGYGYFDKTKAHRFAWEIYRGPIPADTCVLHRCDVRPCVNPAHLFLGSKADNSADCQRKNRYRVGPRNWHSKLTYDQVREIRKLAALGPKKLAKQFGVSRAAIWQIVRRISYKEA